MVFNYLDPISGFIRHHQAQLPFVAAAIGYIGISLALRRISGTYIADAQIIASPRKTLLPRLTADEVADLPYPPDLLPGARDVNSPFGVLRVYEWGPEDGRKVLLVHGISVPCISLAGVAHGLVEKGHRVMLFDLWGRGYSDSPYTLPHDNRLYTSSILLALSSSPISWTGSSLTFSVIGYSLGGGIAASFASYFPHLVSSLVLIAPAGLVRTSRSSNISRILYSSGYLPEKLLEWLVKTRLQNRSVIKPSLKGAKEDSGLAGEDLIGQEVPENEKSSEQAVLSKSRPHVSVDDIVGWQVDNHDGFVKSFMSSIRHGPISNQHSDWKRMAERLDTQNRSTEEGGKTPRSQKGKVLIICGEHDSVIIKDELIEDVSKVLGENNTVFMFCDAGHDLPIQKSGQIVGYIVNFWGGQ